MNKLTRISATVASSLALVAGFSGVANANSSTIRDTGRDSNNRISVRDDRTTRVNNDTDVELRNSTVQTSLSGHVQVSNNDDVDVDAESGDAWNDNYTEAMVHVDNSTSSSAALSGGNGGGMNWDASIEETGRNSNNTITHRSNQTTTVNNQTDVTVDNDTDQFAQSGDVTVTDNDDVNGSVRSGSASNVNTSVFEVHVQN